MARVVERRDWRFWLRTLYVLAALGTIPVLGYLSIWGPIGGEQSRLAANFQRYSGARLVFERSQLPPGEYHEVMTPLSPAGREHAARIAWLEVQKYPRRYLSKLGLSTVGIFDSCVSTRSDGFRDFDEEVQGYWYYGNYNGSNAIVVAFYREQQLARTLHHEIFHHIERIAGLPNPKWANERWAAAISGDELYPPLKLSREDLDALRRLSSGEILDGSISYYSRKNPVEDRAETARYLMTTLPEGLLQASLRPEIPGSQRMLHVLETYRRAPGGHGPDVHWFVDLALARSNNSRRSP